MRENNVDYNDSLSVINMFNDYMNRFSNIWESETKKCINIGPILNTENVG